MRILLLETYPKEMVQRAAIICIIGMVLVVSVSAEPLLDGRVWLPSGAPVPGAQVLLFDLADLRAAPLAATTDGRRGSLHLMARCLDRLRNSRSGA